MTPEEANVRRLLARYAQPGAITMEGKSFDNILRITRKAWSESLKEGREMAVSGFDLVDYYNRCMSSAGQSSFATSLLSKTPEKAKVGDTLDDGLTVRSVVAGGVYASREIDGCTKTQTVIFRPWSAVTLKPKPKAEAGVRYKRAHGGDAEAIGLKTGDIVTFDYLTGMNTRPFDPDVWVKRD